MSRHEAGWVPDTQPAADYIGRHAGMRGWEHDVWNLSEQEAWRLFTLKHRIEANAVRRAQMERDLTELIGILARLMESA